MGIEFALPLSIIMGLLVFGLIAKWYVMPQLSSMSRSAALIPLLLLHSFRYTGMAFLIPGVTWKALDPRFAIPAAYGDLLAAVLALIAIAALRLGWGAAIALVWIFNIVGSIDLINALFQGFQHTPNGHLGSTYFIPAVIVPALLVTHFMIFVLLLKRSSVVAKK
jgi:hypothetical protein